MFSLAERDYVRQDVSSIMEYTERAFRGIDIGLLAGAGYYVAPEVAAGVAASYIPPGIEAFSVAGVLVKTEEIVNIAVVAASTATFTNVLTTLNESAEVLTGRNRMEEIFGKEGYETLKNTAQAATAGILAEVIVNPQYLDKNSNIDAGNIRQNAMYDNGEKDSEASSGQWEIVNESMSDFSREYQKQITGQEGMAWIQNGVKFDGMKDGVLLDAKGKYAQFIDKDTGEFYNWFSGQESLVAEARRQISASEGARIQWYFAEEESLNVVQDLFMRKGITEIELIFQAPK